MSESGKAVFLSYASQDADVARRLCDALRRAGVEVWFDQAELVGGDAWDAKIRKQIRECTLFVPMISANSQARREGYFRLEWKLAAQRTHAMADGTPFLLPVIIDDTDDAEALVPEEFRAVQWTRVIDAAAMENFSGTAKRLLTDATPRSRSRANEPPGARATKPARQLQGAGEAGAGPGSDSSPPAAGRGSGGDATPAPRRDSTGSERRLAAIVFTDVVGYSARMQANEAATMARVSADFARMTELCQQQGGEVLNTMGDGLLMCFGSAVSAVSCGLAMQREFGLRQQQAGSEELQHRVGIHLGDIFRQTSGGVAGDGVNIAARLEPKAPPGGICISQTVYETVKNKVAMQAVSLGPVTFKHITEPIIVWHIAPEGLPFPSASRGAGSVPTPSGSPERPRPGPGDQPPAIPDYELLRAIGHGSYGDVWIARGITGAWRAVKVVWRNRFSNAEPFEREFRGVKESMALPTAEARALAVLHVGRNDAAGFFFYVMELADDASRGVDIDPARYVPLTLKEVRSRRGRLPAAECITLGTELARGLAALHGRGLVHRDIKPSNIILVNGAPKLADIGLLAPATDARTFVGTEGYVPPEGPGSPGGDVFALGKVLYELATGQDRQDYPRLPDAFTGTADRAAFFQFNEVLLRACETNPAKRYRNGGELVADLERLAAGRQPAAAASRAKWIAVVAAAAVACGALGWWVTREQRRVHPAPTAAAPAKSPEKAAEPAIDPRSIAVLPFGNLSPEQSNAYFADGVHEDVLSKLTQIPDLQVVSRTTVMGYRNSTKPAAQIARELNVAFLLEGSVRRDGNTVRLTGQLVDGRTDRQVKSLTFTRSVTDLFALQAELAQTIASELHAELNSGTKANLERAPTANFAAYEEFLKGRRLGTTGTGARVRDEAEKHFRRALELDPNFAVAWAELASLQAQAIFHSRDTTPEKKAEADATMATALRLDAGSPEVQRAHAVFIYNRFRDFAGATVQFEKLRDRFPKDASLYHWLAVVQRRNHQWTQSLANSRRATVLEPANVTYSETLGQTLSGLRRWDEIQAELRRMTALRGGPDAVERRIMSIQARANGTRTEVDAYLASLPPAERETPAILSWRLRRAREQGNLQEYRQLDEKLSQASDAAAPEPTVNLALGYAELGDWETARQRIADRLGVIRTQIERDPTNYIAWQVLAFYEIILGNREEALRCGQKSIEQMTESYDPYFGPQASKMFAAILAWCGEKPKALAELRRLAAMPAGYCAVGELQFDVFFAPLRNEPELREILDWIREHSPLVPERAVSMPAAKPTLAAASVAPAGAKSIVVLPLENLSPDPENAFFTDGMHSEIIATLQRLPGLKVIARDSAITLKRGSASVKELAGRVGVAHVITGSVRRAGNRARIVLELRRASDEALLWTQTYDKTLEDVFAVQVDVANEVAKILLSREAKNDIDWAKLFTKNPQALDAYLKSSQLSHDRSYAAQARAIALMEEALKLDPGFAPAVGGLSSLHSTCARINADRELRPKHTEAAKRYAEQFARLLPGGSGEAPLAFFYTIVERNSEQSLLHFDNAVRALPNSSEVRLGHAIALGMAGRAAEAEESLRLAVELDPFNESAWSFRLVVLATLRRVEDWKAALARVGTFSPRVPGESRVNNQRFALTGEFPADVDQLSRRERLDWLRLKRDFTGILAVLGPEDGDPTVPDGLRFTELMQRHDALLALGRTAEAKAAAEKLMPLFEKMQAAGTTFPDFKERTLSEILLRLGRFDEAVAARERFVAAGTSRGAQTDRWTRDVELARFYARAGRPRPCVALLAKLLTIPCGLTTTELKRDPDFDRVRDDAGFKALLADPRNSGPLPPGSDGSIAPVTVALGGASGPPVVARLVAPTPASPAPAPIGAAPALKITLPGDPLPDPMTEKSLVVLPLENLSPDPADSYFAEGMHAEIVSTLQRVSDLKVTPRPAVLGLKAGNAPVKEVAEKLSVTNALRGSVRRGGTKVRIALELVRARDEALLWTKTYDRELKDALAIQTEIADEIARLLQARGTTGLHAAQFLTRNPEAYDRYLKSMSGERERLPALSVVEKGIEELREIVALDPNFMPAVSRLSQAHTMSYIMTADPVKKMEHARQAKKWGDEAARLMPGPFGDMARVYYYTRVEIDNARSIAMAEATVRAQPLLGGTYFYLAQALIYAGRPADALEPLRRMNQLNSAHRDFLLEFAALAALRRTAEWEKLRQDSGAPPGIQTEGRYRLTGDLPASLEQRGDMDARLWLWLKRDFAELLRRTDRALASPTLSEGNRILELTRKHRSLLRLGRADEARAVGAEIQKVGEKLAHEPSVDPTAGRRWVARGLAAAGRYDEAVVMYRRWVDGASPTNQVQERWNREKEFAEALAWMGRTRESVEIIAKLLAVPSGLTVPMLKTAPDWDGLREDARFQALLQDPKNNAPF